MFTHRKTPLFGLSLLIISLGALFLHTQISQSADLTDVSVTLSNARPSFAGKLTAGNSAGSSQVIIDTTPSSNPSLSANQLVGGDTVSIGEQYSMADYTVDSINSASTFNITSGLAAGDADSGDDVISTVSATHTVRFTTASAVTDGSFQVLVPALTDDTNAADGIPDGEYFDFSETTPTVTCPNNISGYTFAAGTAAASSVTINGTDYHAFECSYTGSGGVGTAFDGGANGAITIDSLINPAPADGHTTGTADAHQILVRHLDSGSSVVDSTSTSVGLIEAVRIMATIPPQLSFQIAGVASSTSACGVSTDITTSATEVDFGEISITSFKTGAQSLTVSTNATNGYTVTAIANDQLGRDGGACAGDALTASDTDCIQDSRGDTSTMTHSVEDEFNSTSTKGFGYSLHDSTNSISNGDAEAFSYDDTTGGCSGTFCARQFADQEDSQSATEIFGSNTNADSENLYVCYRLIAPTEAQAGSYENFIRYTATATF